MKYIIGIGTNIGNRKENIEQALQALALVPQTKVLRASGIYETAPVGYADQPNFYNACAEAESALTPQEMLGVCLGIEAGFGRIREFKNGPRILDLDLILAENTALETLHLILPHPRFRERRFVLMPLQELFPTGNAYGVDFADDLQQTAGQAVQKV